MVINARTTPSRSTVDNRPTVNSGLGTRSPNVYGTFSYLSTYPH